MECNVKKLLATLGVMSTILTLPMQAEVEDLNEERSPLVNAPAVCMVEDGYGVYLFGEYLLWTPTTEALTIGFSGIGKGDQPLPEGENLAPKDKSLSGVRVGIGTNLEHDGWNTALSYTWLSRNEKKGEEIFTGDTAGIAIPIFNLPDQLAALLGEVDDLSIHTNWKYQYHNIDFDLGRPYFTGKYFVIHPHTGIKLLFTKHKIHNSVATVAEEEEEPTTVSHNQSQTFLGLGVRTGVSPSFYLTESWSLYSDIAFSLPYGQVKATTEEDTFVKDGSTTYGNHFSVKRNIISPVIETSIGLRFDSALGDCEDWHLRVQLGWEEQVFLNQIHLVNIINGSVSEQNATGKTLSQQGLTARVEFCF